MPSVFIPQVNTPYRLTSDWSTELDWEQRNLVLLKNLKLTGTKKEKAYGHLVYDEANGGYKKDENGHYIRTGTEINRTVANPLFRDDDGNYVPVTVTFPEDLVFRITRYRTGYNGSIDDVWLRVDETPDKRFAKRVVSVTIEQFEGAPFEEVK